MAREPYKDPFEGLPRPRLFGAANAGVAQLGERFPCKQDVAGSIPAAGSILDEFAPLYGAEFNTRVMSATPAEIGALRNAIASIPATKGKRGPKKGFGGRPIKTGAVSKRTLARRNGKNG